MVGISEHDRNLLRFLWPKNPNDPNSIVEHYRFTRLVFGLRSSPAVLGAVISHHLQQHKERYPEVVELINESLYVDDLISGGECDESAFQVYEVSKQVMASGGFNLRKWNSNSETLLKRIHNAEVKVEILDATCDEAQSKKENLVEEDESYVKSTTGASIRKPDQATTKVLGIDWNFKTDNLQFSLIETLEYAKKLPSSKRSILKVTAKLFDPLGLLSPFIINLKMLFQTLCIDNVGWDDELNEGVRVQWERFNSQLKLLESIQVPRCYFSLEFEVTGVQLHAFSDVSEKAYAAVLYVRSVYINGHVKVRILASKTRVAPIKKQSIPRLELLGAVILARLTNVVRKTFPSVDKIIYWVDSSNVLYWIGNEKLWKRYVNNRVAEEKESWRHYPGKLNPADLPSRGLNAQELKHGKLWWNGPDFLQLPESDWPENVSITEMKEEVTTELCKTYPNETHVLTSSSDVNSASTSVNCESIFDVKRYGSLTILLRVTAYVLRFIRNVKKLRHFRIRAKEKVEPISAEEITRAEIMWIKTVQSENFSKEIQYLQDTKKAIPERVDQFGLFIDEDGIMKCKGRIGNTTLPLSSKCPTLLPSKHSFVDLVINDVHERTRHSGISHTLSTLRERFWLIKGRQSVKRILRHCVVCRKIEGRPYTTGPAPDLPSIRVSEDPPFSHTGVDFAGPIFVKERSPSKSEEKTYICLFTCASTRAVHLELTRSLTVDSFLLAFRRFASRRGLPSTIVSDNAKTFKAASREIIKLFKSPRVIRYFSENRINWTFIVEKAAWWGGFWERMVKVVKLSLKKSLGRTSLNFEELRTLLIEVEAVVNLRPLTYVYDDQDGLNYALSPSHLIYGRKISNLPNTEHFEIVSTFASLTRKSLHHKRLLEQFTKFWRREYLLNLREHYTNKKCQKLGVSIKLGDVVILRNDSTKRLFWKLAIVQELLPGSDGRVRAAVVRVAGSGDKTQLLRRSIKHLIPIEVKLKEEQDGSSDNTDLQKNPELNRRKAAVEGERLRRLNNT